MRLIDGDELERKIRWYGGNTAGLIPDYELRNAPTVKAIPIEWLKNESKDLADAYWNNVRNKLVLEMKDLPLVMEEIVRIWERENETN